MSMSMFMSMSMVVYECHFKLPFGSLFSGNKYLVNFACYGMENTEILVNTTSQLFLLLQKSTDVNTATTCHTVLHNILLKTT